uniref:CLK4-associating serine/arginine rich protein n=1 Tax=Zeugodacus cucurbitae TaxID=28588 RepID=A0A0A1X7D9_ZEUCU
MWHEARKQERRIRGMIVDYRKRAERRQDFYEKIQADPTQFIQVHGRRCKIHLDPATAAAGDGAAIIVPWQGQQDNLIDRFDVRAHLDYIPAIPKVNEAESTEVSVEERQCNYERYRILAQNDFLNVTEEKFLHQLYLEEQFGANAQLEAIERSSSKKKQSKSGVSIGYIYEEGVASTTAGSHPFHPTTQEKTTGKSEKGSDSESDSDMDMDVSIDISKLDTSQAHELNGCGRNYGMVSNDFYSYLTKDADEAEALRIAREEEQEKMLLSGRKSRRERRAQKERRIACRPFSPPSYAAKEDSAAKKDKDEESESRSPSPDPNAGKITYITSFGGEDELQPHSKISISIGRTPQTLGESCAGVSATTGALTPQITYAQKVKENLEKLKQLNEGTKRSTAMGKTSHSSRSRSRSRKRTRSRSRSRRRSKRRSRERRRRPYSRSRSRSRLRSQSRSRRHRHRRSRSISYERSRRKRRSRRSSTVSDSCSRSRSRSRSGHGGVHKRRYRSTSSSSHRSRRRSSRSVSSGSRHSERKRKQNSKYRKSPIVERRRPRTRTRSRSRTKTLNMPPIAGSAGTSQNIAKGKSIIQPVINTMEAATTSAVVATSATPMVSYPLSTRITAMSTAVAAAAKEPPPPPPPVDAKGSSTQSTAAADSVVAMNVLPQVVEPPPPPLKRYYGRKRGDDSSDSDSDTASDTNAEEKDNVKQQAPLSGDGNDSDERMDVDTTSERSNPLPASSTSTTGKQIGKYCTTAPAKTNPSFSNATETKVNYIIIIFSSATERQQSFEFARTTETQNAKFTQQAIQSG